MTRDAKSVRKNKRRRIQAVMIVVCALALLVLAADIATGWYSLNAKDHWDGRVNFTVSNGRLCTWVGGDRNLYPTFRLENRIKQSPRRYWFEVRAITDGNGGLWGRLYFIPLWVFWIGLLGVGVLLWRKDKRVANPGVCGACGYELGGITGAVCPECGASNG